MIIALYIYKLEGGFGGAEKSLIRIANYLASIGHDIHIITLDNPATDTFYPLHDKIVWHKIGWPKGVIGKIIRTYRVADILRKIHCRRVIGFLSSADKTLYLATFLARSNLVAAERSSPLMYQYKLGKLKFFFHMFIMQINKKIVVQFEQYKYDYPTFLQSKIVVIPNYVDKPPYAVCKPIYQRDNTIITCARFTNEKNIHLILIAFSMLDSINSGWTVKIFGDGPERESLQNLSNELGISNKVSFRGVSKNLSYEYLNAKIYIIPSKWEGFPNSLAEALSCGLPAIGFKNCPGVSNLIIDNNNGLLVEPFENAEKLAESMSKLMLNPEKLEKLSQNASSSMHLYSEEKVMPLWKSIIKDFS